MTKKQKWNMSMLASGGVMLLGIISICLPPPWVKLTGAVLVLLGFIGAVVSRIGEGLVEHP